MPVSCRLSAARRSEHAFALVSGPDGQRGRKPPGDRWATNTPTKTSTREISARDKNRPLLGAASGERRDVGRAVFLRRLRTRRKRRRPPVVAARGAPAVGTTSIGPLIDGRRGRRRTAEAAAETPRKTRRRPAALFVHPAAAASHCSPQIGAIRTGSEAGRGSARAHRPLQSLPDWASTANDMEQRTGRAVSDPLRSDSRQDRTVTFLRRAAETAGVLFRICPRLGAAVLREVVSVCACVSSNDLCKVTVLDLRGCKSRETRALPHRAKRRGPVFHLGMRYALCSN